MRTSRHPSRSTSRIASLTFGINLGSANARQDQVVVLELGCLHWSRFPRAEVHCWRDVLVAIIDGRQFRQPPLTLPPLPFPPRRACPRKDGGGNPSLITAPPPVVLADAGTHPHPSFPRRPCPREDGGGNPSANPAPHSSSPHVIPSPGPCHSCRGGSGTALPRGISLPYTQRLPPSHRLLHDSPTLTRMTYNTMQPFRFPEQPF